MQNTVYLLLRHPQHPYTLRGFMGEALVKGVFADKAQAKTIADQKNKTAVYWHWSVKAKRVTPKVVGR